MSVRAAPLAPQCANEMFSPVVSRISFCLLPAGRIGHIDVSERVLPSQPFADLGHGAEIEGGAILAGVIQVGEEIQLLGQHSIHPQFVIQFLAHRSGRKAAAGEESVFLTGVVDAAEQVQCGASVLDRRASPGRRQRRSAGPGSAARRSGNRRPRRQTAGA